MPPTLDFVYFDAGGGHRSATLALQSVIASEGYPWNVRLLNLQELLDPLDGFRQLTGYRTQDLYNLLLAKGWTLGTKYLLRFMHFVIRRYHSRHVDLLAKVWRERRPDLVVSLVPNFNRALFDSLAKALPGTPFVTILTDLADYPPHFWIEQQPQYFICGTDRAVAQALSLGHPPTRVFRVSGMILRPQFYENKSAHIDGFAALPPLDSHLPTGLVLFGGEGSHAMYSIAQRLGNSAAKLQLILICGRNAALQNRLEHLRTSNRLHVVGFTADVPLYMRSSDFFIGKPGPGSISEALHMGLPAIVEKNAWTLPQERFNADWVGENGLGLVLPNFRGIENAVEYLLEGDRLARMKAKALALNNRAVFEIPQVLAKILEPILSGI
ncbi:MAG: glycosyltransferase [Bryobacteraceae bacterium]